MTYSAQTEPLSLLQGVFEDDWEDSEGRLPKPKFYIWNETPKKRLSIDKMDIVTLQYESPEYQQEWEGATHEYYNERFFISVRIKSAKSRQRMMDIFGEVRRICFANQHNYSRIGWKTLEVTGMRESPDSKRLNWEFEMSLMLEHLGKPVTT